MLTRVLLALVFSACAPAPSPAPPRPVVISSVRETEPPKPAPTQPIAVDSNDPREVLKAFLTAYEQKQYDLVIRFAPASEAAGLTVEKLKAVWEGPDRDLVQKAMSAMRSAVEDARIEVQGSRAIMFYGPSSTVSLVKEDGVWKVDNF